MKQVTKEEFYRIINNVPDIYTRIGKREENEDGCIYTTVYMALCDKVGKVLHFAPPSKEKYLINESYN